MAGIAAAGFLFSTRILISYGVHFTRLCREGVGRWVPACGARPPVIPAKAGIHPSHRAAATLTVTGAASLSVIRVLDTGIHPPTRAAPTLSVTGAAHSFRHSGA